MAAWFKIEQAMAMIEHMRIVSRKTKAPAFTMKELPGLVRRDSESTADTYVMKKLDEIEKIDLYDEKAFPVLGKPVVRAPRGAWA